MKHRQDLVLAADFYAARLLLEEMSVLAKLSERAAEFFDRLIRLAEGGLELFVFESDCAPTPGAAYLLVVAKPSDGLLRAMAAARAGDFNLSVLEDAFGHGAFSPSLTERAGAGVKAGSRTDKKPTPIPGAVGKGGAA